MLRCCGIAAGKRELAGGCRFRMAGGCRALRDPAGRSAVASRSLVPNGGTGLHQELLEQEDFTFSDLLRQHHIVSLVNVPVLIAGAAWGVLEIDSTSPRDFSQDTIDFLTAAAALIAAFVQRHTAEPGEAARVAAAAVEAQTATCCFVKCSIASITAFS